MLSLTRSVPFVRLIVGGCLLFCSALARGEESRTWTDSTGRHKIAATFVTLEDGKVTLEKADGSMLEIPLTKLSKADQKYVAEAMKAGDDNPFQDKEKSPFEAQTKKKSTGSQPAKTKGASPKAASSEGPQTLEIDWSRTEQVSLANTDKWQVDVPAAVEGFASKPKTSPLPNKSNFFEGINGIAVNCVAGRAAVALALDDPKPTGTTRTVLCDLATGKASPVASESTKMAPLAVHDDGKQIVMRRDEWGFGNQDRLELWTLKGPRVERHAVWFPYGDAQGDARSVAWGEFLDSTHLATSSRDGKVVIWSFPAMEPLTSFNLGGGAVPGLSPDRTRIAYCSGKEIGIYDVVRGEVIAQQPTPQQLQWPSVAFSPSGKQLACLAFDKVLMWDVATGNLERTVPCTGIHVQGKVEFPADNFVLVSGKFLIDVENQLKFWTYEDQQQVVSANGWTFFAVSDGEQKPGALVAAQIPQPKARDLLQKALTDPALFVLHSGTTVKLNLNGIPDAAEKEHVRKALTDRLQTIGCQIGDNGTIELAASMEGPKERQVSYRGSGDYKLKEYIGRAKFLYQGQTAWESWSTNIPGIISLKKGENVGDHLRAREKPDYTFFDRLELPRFLQKPSAGQGAGGSLTMGQSKVTTSGLK